MFANLSFYIPEILAVATMCLLLVGEAFYSPRHDKRTGLYILGFTGLLGVLIALVLQLSSPAAKILDSAVTIDSFSTMAKILLVLGSIGTLYLGILSKEIYRFQKGEFFIMTVGVLVGGMLLASANNFLILYLGIEILSILSYVMASFRRDDSRSNESGLKYILYGGVTAGLMLFGISHLYGLLGSIEFDLLSVKMASLSGQEYWVVMVSFLLFFAGLGYKISAVPFHMWSPDVYEGSPTPVTAFFALVPKIAGIAVLIRVSMVFFADNSSLAMVWVGMLHIVAALTMTVGNITAIGQNSVKRLLAFSSIGHIGMMLLGVVTLDESGAQAILFYSFTYIFMTLVAFYITSHIVDTYGSDHKIYFQGLIHKHPLMAICMIVVLFSLAGLPPLSGFVAKYNIFSVVISKKYYGLAAIAGINSVIALYYYMGLVKTIVFGKAEEEGLISRFTASQQFIIFLLFIPVVSLGIFWDKVITIAKGASLFIK